MANLYLAQSLVLMRRLLAILILLLAGATVSPVEAATPADVQALFTQLRSDDFDQREYAAERLLSLSDDPTRREAVAVECLRLLDSLDTPVDVRARLVSMVEKLSIRAEGRSPQSGEIATAIAALDDDDFTVRTGGRVQIEQWLSQGRSIVPIFERLKQAAGDSAAHVSRDGRRRLLQLVNLARDAWLAAPADQCPLNELPSSQLDRWLSLVSQRESAAANAEERLAVELAEQEILDRLANPPDVEQVVVALRRQLADPSLADDARSRLETLLDWTRPAMVAEIWHGGRQRTIQHLLIGQPSQVPGADNPTHFDRIDDRAAHCVSGNSLSLGDWPVGVFFPNPRANGWQTQFFLINLPTPRARLAYNVWSERSEPQRFRELTERSAARWLEAGRSLSPAEITMLGRLDRPAVRRFVGQYLQTVGDEPLPDEYSLAGECRTRHGLLCLTLCQYGDAATAQMLSDLIRRGRLQGETKALASLAIVSIAGHESWPGMNGTLLDLATGNSMPAGETPLADVQASAAALLLTRSGHSPTAFGIHSNTSKQAELQQLLLALLYGDEARFGAADEAEADRLRLPLYGFENDAARRRALAWCRDRLAAKVVRP